MRKMLAVLLLFCVGIMIPTSASPVRICLLELHLDTSSTETKCCPDCSRETEQPEPCCHDLEELPDAPAPQSPTELPAVVLVDLPAAICPSPMVAEGDSGCFSVSEPIRGPTSPTAYRAVLGIWRL
jgi:hypothetical protein